MFILAPIKNGILLIDQHAAHERILYEQALEDLKVGRATSQQLLFPIVLQLTATEQAVVESWEEYFRAFGFDIQDFGGNRGVGVGNARFHEKCGRRALGAGHD